ncbi:MAG: hypothetical protein U5K75_02160 [Ahrensia sp.]|nr:hypothetical protein [Ahrensia sp.]
MQKSISASCVDDTFIGKTVNARSVSTSSSVNRLREVMAASAPFN